MNEEIRQKLIDRIMSDYEKTVKKLWLTVIFLSSCIIISWSYVLIR